MGARRGTACDDWLPGADLRRVRALPVLVIAGSSLDAAVASVVEDLADAEISVEQQAPSELDRFEPRTVAVLNRGVPGFAVDTEGTLHTSLMRSCTGWPSGVWMDPSRAAPHPTAPTSSCSTGPTPSTTRWSPATAIGDGGRPRPQRGVLPPAAGRRRKQQCGRIARWGSLLEIEPAGSLQLGALKAAGNPFASGSGRAVDPADGVAVRLVETCGATTDVVIRSGLHRVSAASRVDLLEQPRLQHHASDGLTLHGYEIATVLTRLNMPQVLDADHTALAPEVEAAQPLYARYWLHNRGPAPLGGLPAVAHLHPQHLPSSRIRKCC